MLLACNAVSFIAAGLEFHKHYTIQAGPTGNMHDATLKEPHGCVLSRVCVCVCHALFLRVLRVLGFAKAGGSRACSWREPTKLQVQTRISKEDALSTYLPSTVAHAVYFSGLLPWFLHDDRHKHF